MIRAQIARRLALQILFAWDANMADLDSVARSVVREEADEVARTRAVETARGAWVSREVNDRWLERISPDWPPRRMPAVDRNLLRLAVWELTDTDTPPKVVLDEAIEIAREYSTAESAAFVNGVLDTILREIRELRGS
ncbi:MAG: transcription antitermination factor NusB [Phycisphaerae bacterium]